MVILFWVYVLLGYMAVPHTVWRNKIIIEYKNGAIFARRLLWGALFGWLLIPWWLLFSRNK